MKQLTFWACSLALMFIMNSCGNGTSFTVKGTLADKSHNGAKLLLQQINFETGETKVLDSTVVKDDKFEFKGEAKTEPEFNVITQKTPDGKVPALVFVREPGDIEIKLQSNMVYTLSGTKANDQFQKMQKGMFDLQQKAMSVTSQDQQQALVKEMVGLVYDYVKDNMKNKTGEQMFASIAYQLTPEQVKGLLKDARPSFTQKEQIKMLQQTMEAKSKMASSNEYQDVQATDKDGKAVALSNFVGKSNYVLVDFWASWCGPCMAEVPNIAAAYAKYKAKGFEVVSISLDKDDESWLKAVSENKMVWPQLHDAAGKAAEIYGVQSIPFTILIDKSGKIVAQNLRGTALDEKLSELLK